MNTSTLRPLKQVGHSRLELATLIAALVASLTFEVQAQQMIHRYSFDTDAGDLIGNSDGELAGDAMVSDGAVVLSGNKPSYVNLPNDLVSTLTNVTIEMWVTWNGGNAWQRIIDFGNNDNGEDLQGVATQSLFITPNNGSGFVLSIFPNGIGGQQVITAPSLSVGELHHVVWTYDANSKIGRVYRNGAQIGVNSNMTHTLAGLGSTANNWIGHSQYGSDADFSGSVAEFRIYDGALSAETVLANFETGPDPSGRGPLLALRIVARPAMRPGSSQQLQVIADFQNVKGIAVTADPGLAYQVSNPAVLGVTSTGYLTAVGTGDANGAVTVTFQGKSASQDIQVIAAVPPVLIHRYSFTTDASDSAGTAHGELIGDAMVMNGAVVLSGTKPSYVNLPNDLVSSLTNATIEMWVTWNGGPFWQRIFDFGNTGAEEDVQVAAAQSIFLTPDNGGAMDLSIFPNGIGGQQVINAPPLSSGVLHHLVWTDDALASVSRLYLDGNQVGVNSNMTYTLAALGSTVNNWIGHSQYIQDSDFAGSIAEFRIYNGVLSAENVSTNQAVGPDPGGRGALVKVSVSARPVMLVRTAQQLQVIADFENVFGVNITSEPGVTFQVSDPPVLSVSASGLLTTGGSSSGTASVTATYQGKSDSQADQVIIPAAPVLLHRYSFTTDASDSVGTAHGELVGDAALSAGAVTLSGTKPSYVNLPNDLFTSLTNATFEMWITWNGGSVWQRIFDFGNSGVEEDQQSAATQSIFLTPSNGGVMDLSIFPDGIGGQQVINAPPLQSGIPYHIVWSDSAEATTSRLFVDGVQVGINPGLTYTLAGLGSTINNWLGHSQYIQDADFAGSFSEFRIYNGTFLDGDVAASFAAGPDQLPSEAVALAIALQAGKVVISWPSSATGFALESRTLFGPGGSWSPAGLDPVLVNERYQVTLDPTSSATYFRAIKR